MVRISVRSALRSTLAALAVTGSVLLMAACDMGSPAATPISVATPVATVAPTKAAASSSSKTAKLPPAIAATAIAKPARITGAGPTAVPRTFPNCQATTNDALEKAVVPLVNAERAKQNLPPMTEQAQLDAAAREESMDNGCNNVFDHTGTDGSSPFDRLTRYGYQYQTAGENIAAGSDTAEATMTQWMNSEGHRANILNPDFTEIGVGYAAVQGSDFTHYWTQTFGKPQQP